MFCTLAALAVQSSRCAAADSAAPPAWLKDSAAKLETELAGKYGEPNGPGCERGLRRWASSGGPRTATPPLSRRSSARTSPATRPRWTPCSTASTACWKSSAATSPKWVSSCGGRPIWTLARCCRWTRLRPATTLRAHLTDDFFANKLAFVALLNFPLTTFQERLAEGDKWSRRQWAETRLAGRFGKRIPAAVLQGVSQSQSDAELYIAEYKICMHHLLDAAGRRPFPPKLRLVAHWNLRDEIKAQYPAGAEGLAKQRMIERVLERIVDQSIPAGRNQQPTGGLESRHQRGAAVGGR